MDEFEQAQAEARPGYVGWWEKVIPQLTDEQQASLQKALRNRDITHTVISKVLGQWGHKVSYQQVGHYRRTYVER